MKCIYCEENETKSVLLCYGCQVDLFPLVSPWAYCGHCGQELTDNRTLCPQCAPPACTSVPVNADEPAPPTPVDASALMLSPPSKKAPLPSLIPEPPATPAEIKAARRFQWLIRAAFGLFWLSLLLLVLWWFRGYVNEPVDGVLP